jgi:hypothetical protein
MLRDIEMVREDGVNLFLGWPPVPDNPQEISEFRIFTLPD